jgi:hypothetical protein
MWAAPKIVFDFFRKRRRKQEEALTNQAGKQDQKQGSCLVLEGEILLKLAHQRPVPSSVTCSSNPSR